MNNIEIGTCDVCGKENVELNRKYYRYDVKCACHGDYHFEIVFHCNNCIPKEPKYTKITYKTDYLEKIVENKI